MACKAELFGDAEMKAAIMATDSPRKQKSLGQKVSNFSDTVWKKKRFRIVFEGNMAKFSQNPILREELLRTAHKMLVEASPYDRIWGIGLSPQDADALKPSKWRGENLLGQILMQVRATIRDQMTSD